MARGIRRRRRLKMGLNKEMSRAAERAASTEELSNNKPVLNRGSESSFLFCASDTDGTT